MMINTRMGMYYFFMENKMRCLQIVNLISRKEWGFFILGITCQF